MAAKKVQETRPITGFVMPLGVIGTLVATWFHFPGAVLLWLLMLVCALQHPMPQLPKVTGLGPRPRPDQLENADPKYASKASRAKFVRSWRAALFFSRDLISFPWPTLSFIGSIGVGLVAGSLSEENRFLPDASALAHVLNGVCAAAVFGALVTARRSTVVSDDVMPPITLKHVVTTFKATPAAIIAPGALALVLSIIAGVVLSGLKVGEPSLLYPGLALALVTVAVWAAASRAPREKFFRIAGARVEWYGRFDAIKLDPPPRLIDQTIFTHTQGDAEGEERARVETFSADARMGGYAGTDKLRKNLSALLGGSYDAALVPRPQRDKQGQDMPGTVHPNEFDIISFPAGQVPTVTDENVDDDLVKVIIRSTFVDAEEVLGAPLLFIDATRISVDDAPSLFLVDYAGVHPKTLADSSATMSSAFGCDVLVDQRAGWMVIGDASTQLSESSPVTAEAMDLVQREAYWSGRWAAVMKSGVNPPVPALEMESEAKLKTGQTIHQIPFKSREGMNVSTFMAYEPDIRTILHKSQWAALAHWDAPNRARAGERHSMAFSLRYCDEPGVPLRPDDLEDIPRSDAPKWVLTDLIWKAFKASNLHRPEVTQAQVVARGRRGRGWIWKMKVRLFEGDTLSMVRSKAVKIRESFNGEWMRIQDAEDGCIIWAGISPSKATFTSQKIEAQVDALDWEQVCIDLKLVNPSTGKAPRMTSSERMAGNQEVKLLTFDLEGTGLSKASFKDDKVLAKLQVATGNQWLDVASGPTSRHIVMRMCEHDPMPASVAHNWAMIFSEDGMTFGVDMEGAPVKMNPKKDPHLLFSGPSGSGKSVTLQSMLAAAIGHRWDIVVMDPSKGAADYGFATKYALQVATDVYSAGASMTWLYEEVKRRKALNMQHRVGNYKDLPDGVRPSHMLVMIDEFTSLMIPDSVPQVTGDPEADAEREALVASNAIRAKIGTLTGRIAREARSVGFSLVLATQSLKADTLKKIPGSNDLKDNMSRLILGKASFGQMQAALKQPEESPSLGEVVPKGRGVFETNEDGFKIFQSFYSPGEQETIAQALEEVRPDGVETLDLSAFMPAKPDDTPAVVDLDEDPTAVGETREFEELDFEDLDFGFDEDEEEAPEVPAPAQDDDEALPVPESADAPEPGEADPDEPERVALDEEEADEDSAPPAPKQRQTFSAPPPEPRRRRPRVTF